mmetsp:Transcript_3885/g.10401  ORF Transcript_3885/g.10401 Transcript_3885/m.10401 type:complete len:306 (+) Transcript_3885:2645-3562(+)
MPSGTRWSTTIEMRVPSSLVVLFSFTERTSPRDVPAAPVNSRGVHCFQSFSLSLCVFHTLMMLWVVATTRWLPLASMHFGTPSASSEKLMVCRTAPARLQISILVPPARATFLPSPVSTAAVSGTISRFTSQVPTSFARLSPIRVAISKMATCLLLHTIRFTPLRLRPLTLKGAGMVSLSWLVMLCSMTCVGAVCTATQGGCTTLLSCASLRITLERSVLRWNTFSPGPQVSLSMAHSMLAFTMGSTCQFVSDLGTPDSVQQRHCTTRPPRVPAASTRLRGLKSSAVTLSPARLFLSSMPCNVKM